MSLEDDSPIVRFLAAVIVVTVVLVPGSAGATKPSPLPPGPALFKAGAAVASITPPPHGSVVGDPGDCSAPASFNGLRRFAFEEPYRDDQQTGHFASGDAYVDCNGNGRWDGIVLGGGADTPRFASIVADDVSARALVVSNHHQVIAVEVLDQEGVFNVYQERIRAKVAADGYHLDNIFISATHDESAPDTLGISGIDQLTSGVDAYYVDFLVARSAQAIEDAYDRLRPARLKYAEAIEPANLRQCWSSYPFVDDQLMPALQAVATNGTVIATLGDVSQHAETLGFNPDPEQRTWISADWPHFFRTTLEHRYGGVAIEMAGSVGSNETPEVFSGPDLARPAAFRQRVTSRRLPHDLRRQRHANPCRLRPRDDGARSATRRRDRRRAGQLGNVVEVRRHLGRTPRRLHPAHECSLRARCTARRLRRRVPDTATTAPSNIRSRPTAQHRATSCCRKSRPSASVTASSSRCPARCSRSHTCAASSVAQDMPKPEFPLPPWVVPHMHAPYRFVDGLAEDMLGYIFPRGNGVGVVGEPGSGDGPDRFGCGHSDDSEATTSQAGDLVGTALVDVLDQAEGAPEDVRVGRYVLPDGTRSRNPLGVPSSIKCDIDTVFTPLGPAVGVWLAGTPTAQVIVPAAWMSLSGRRQAQPDRNTRGWIDSNGTRHWLDVFPDTP